MAPAQRTSASRMHRVARAEKTGPAAGRSARKGTQRHAQARMAANARCPVQQASRQAPAAGPIPCRSSGGESQPSAELARGPANLSHQQPLAAHQRVVERHRSRWDLPSLPPQIPPSNRPAHSHAPPLRYCYCHHCHQGAATPQSSPAQVLKAAPGPAARRVGAAHRASPPAVAPRPSPRPLTKHSH